MTDRLMSKAATMEIPIHGNGDSRRLAEDDGLEQDLQQVMVSGPNLNETSIVSGGYGGTAEGIIPTSSIQGPLIITPSPSAASRIARQAAAAASSSEIIPKVEENGQYDAYRTDLEELNLGPRDAGTLCRLDAAQANFQAHRIKYEKLRADVAVKLKFLEENKVKVMHKQLLLFHNAISAYFAGNQQQLEQSLKQFSVKLKSPGADKPSWLEEQ
ncbi:PREDICTED: arfaptin-2 [Gekko japonicus]|uniref:Arfaptin-2 n=1 Tax=Gekko japonicus TaxID=146911 RepID=A0ABM1L3F7_GEKJA|nr:PREDICTED: arfaptin-2 [Gekko japonicus]